MPEYEVTDASGLRVRVEAASEDDALEQAVDLAGSELDNGSVTLVDGPVGAEGGDAEQAESLGQSLDVGDYP